MLSNSHSAPTNKAKQPTTADDGRDVLLRELAAIRRSEAILRDFIETSTIGLHWVGADGTILWVNQAELDLLGYSKEEYVGRNIAEFHADESVINNILGRLARGETLRDYAAQLRHRDGSIRHVLINSSVLFEDGEFVHTRCFTRDVTSLRQEQDVHRLLAAIVDSSDDAIFSKNLAGTIESWNAGAKKLFGYSAGEIIGKPMSVLLPPDRLSEFPDILARIRTGGHLDRYEVTLMCKDGRRVNVSVTISPIKDSVGRLVGSSTIARDITDRRQAEANLRESEERFRSVFEEGPLGLALVARDYKFFKVNSALCQMVGYSEAELVHKTFADVTHPDDLQADVQLAERLFRGEIPFYRIQKRYVKKNGEIIWINLTASMIRDFQGIPTYGIAMVEDITEMKRTQEEAFFRQKLESIGTLAGGIAHDFNNLLGAVQAHAELAMTELDAGASCNESLQAIREATMRGSEIVRQLMIYAGTENAAVGRVDLSKTVEEMLSLLRVSITKHAIIQADLDPHLPPIRASAAKVQQIAMNLITNASDAIGDCDGVIRISTRRFAQKGQSAGRSSVELSDGDYVQLEVSDTGHGMSSHTQAMVFDPFFTTKSVGRGLGLAVVQGIVRSLGGAISVTSEPGKGASFQILLPCDESMDTPTCQAVSGPAESAVQVPHGSVLVVEDEDDLRHAVVKMLRKSGYRVFEAGDGSSAIDLLRAQCSEIELILLDVTIPGASSQEIIAEAATSRPQIKVVLTSAYSHEMLASTVNSPQIRGFIRKPFRFGDLLKILAAKLPVE